MGTLSEFRGKLDAHASEVLREAADKLTLRDAVSLWDTVNNILLSYGFFNPANSVPETEKIFNLFREHLVRNHG